MSDWDWDIIPESKVEWLILIIVVLLLVIVGMWISH